MTTKDKDMTSEKPEKANKNKKVKGQYHHGNLRQTLLDEAAGIISEQGIDLLTMRSLSERAGVSRSALYHHFKDKSDLISAIAQNGYIEMVENMQRIFENEEASITAKLEAFMLNYIHFAADNPEIYHIMFGREIWQNAPSEQLMKTARTSFRMYAEILTDLNDKGAIRVEDPLRVAQVTWGTLHGLSSLMIDGIFARTGDLEEITKFGLKLLLQSFTMEE